ncbi:MAG: STAS/SEC14 domain-containing protein [Alphaproteobacteria bacterium]|nr:STAS/SEC14 domain-containing protein [Alphaproteobacteria bacterium]
MPYRYEIRPSFNLIIDKFDGEMAWEDVFEGLQKCSKDPEFRPGMNVLGDMTTAAMDLRYEGMRRLTDSMSAAPTMRYGRVAVVAPESLQFGIARMFEPLSDKYNIVGEFRVFSDFSKARAWLGLPEDLDLRI